MSEKKAPSGRLREATVLEIRKLRDKGWTYQKIAEHVKCSVGTVYNIVKRNTWGWLP